MYLHLVQVGFLHLAAAHSPRLVQHYRRFVENLRELVMENLHLLLVLEGSVYHLLARPVAHHLVAVQQVSGAYLLVAVEIEELVLDPHLLVAVAEAGWVVLLPDCLLD